MIKVENLQWNYKNFRLEIDDVQLKNGITLLVGNNGAGKTTFLHLLATVKRPHKGKILYNQQSIDENLPYIRSKIGFVPTGIELYQDYTVRKLLLYLAQLKGLSKRYAEKQIGDLLSIFHLETVSHLKIKKLSQGMQQRIALIQAFLGKPAYVILDEPLNFLDIQERKTLIQYLYSISPHTMILVATHELNEWEHACHSILWLYNGSVPFTGSITQWKFTPTAKLWVGTIDEDKVEPYFQNYYILGAKKVSEKELELKCLGEEKPSINFQAVNPTMEEALLIRKSLLDKASI